jgi:hypothetical protein
LLGGLPVEFPGVALAKLTLHQLQQPSPVQACTSAAGRLPLYAKGLMEPLSGLMAVPRRSPSVGPSPLPRRSNAGLSDTIPLGLAMKVPESGLPSCLQRKGSASH